MILDTAELGKVSFDSVKALKALERCVEAFSF
jgi:hypothetical protein